MDYSLRGFSVHGILQSRILEWVAIPFSRDLPDPGVEPTSLMSPALVGQFFTTSATLPTSWSSGNTTWAITNYTRNKADMRIT